MAGPGWWQATDGRWYPPRWEYRVVDSPGFGVDKSKVQAQLDELGAEGWEAVGIAGDGVKHLYTVLKRVLR